MNFNYGLYPNSLIRVVGDIAYVQLANCSKEAVIDAIDVPLVENARWILTPGHYVRANNKGSYRFMHRVIAGIKPGMVTDHKNNDRLDNRRSNLRQCAARSNCYNKSLSARNSLGLKGVSKTKRGFRAQIRAEGKSYDLGVYRTAEEASASYCGAAIVLHGSYANFKASCIVEAPEG